MAKIKLAKTELSAESKDVEADKLVEQAKELKEKIFYFDKDNQHKELMALVKRFEKEGFTVYFREIKFGLDENDHIYEMHVLEEA